VEDLFEEQIADTWEAGVKGTFWDGRANGSVSVYYTDFENAYFFFFDAVTSTQNLGSIPEVTYQGVEIEGSALVTDNLSVNFGFGYTDSEIKEAADPADNGNQAPLVSEYTLNLGLLYQRPTQLFGGVNGVIRIDYARTGDTWWEPGNITVRSPYDLVDARVGIEMPDDWSLMLWAKNALDEEYNTEYSPGGFLWPGMPRQWGLEFSKRF
jgi:iron complex outermembrane receptor protein